MKCCEWGISVGFLNFFLQSLNSAELWFLSLRANLGSFTRVQLGQNFGNKSGGNDDDSASVHEGIGRTSQR